TRKRLSEPVALIGSAIRVRSPYLFRIASGLAQGYDTISANVAIGCPNWPIVRSRCPGIIAMHCWDFHNCGEKKKICPAYPGSGKNCALLAGTIGSGQPILTFRQKSERCLRCAFFQSEHYAEEFDGALEFEPF
ncbi:MAG: two-CW domain-containing protein, partial [Desulfurivibrionaceae bacterium]